MHPHAPPSTPTPTPRRRRAGRAAGAALAAAVLAAPLGGCAGFDPFGPQPLAGAAQSAVVGRGNVMVNLAADGTATVSGWVEDRISESSVLSEVASYPGVTGVIDLVQVEDFYR